MSARWQSPLFLTALSAALAGGLQANIARAQCSHGGGSGFNPRMSLGLNSPQLLQQQLQQVQQQQLLQLVQQQQQLEQMAKITRQMRDLAKEGPDAIKTALKSPNPETRLIAVLTINKYGPALTDELIERLTDENAPVRQAARRGLVKLSTVRNGKLNQARSVDFGPVANANRSALETSVRKWRDWFDRQQKREAGSKSIAAKPAERPDISTKIALPAVALVEKTGR
jgi:hypothetical protein